VRTLMMVGLWLVVLLAGLLPARFAQDRWLIATGGALCGANVMALLWSLMLQALNGGDGRALHGLRDLHDLHLPRRPRSPTRSGWRGAARLRCQPSVIRQPPLQRQR
jgi:hypothetical protein